VLGIARRTPGLFHIRPDHRDDGMVGYATFPRTVIVENVTKPKLALLHQIPRRTLAGEKGAR
jgi:hypothetical protein